MVDLVFIAFMIIMLLVGYIVKSKVKDLMDRIAFRLKVAFGVFLFVIIYIIYILISGIMDSYQKGVYNL